MDIGNTVGMRDRKLWSLENSIVGFAALLMIEFVLRKGTVGGRVERGGFDEPWIGGLAHHPGALPGKSASRIVNDSIGQYDRRRKVVGSNSSRATHGVPNFGRNRGVVGSTRCVWIKADRQIGLAGEHDMVTGRVVVRRVGQRPADRP